MSLYIAAYLEDGVLQTEATKLRHHYMNSTTFYVDMLCLLPLDFLYLSLHFQGYKLKNIDRKIGIFGGYLPLREGMRESKK